MDKAKEEQLLKEQKFEHIMFAMDYINKVKEITGELSDDDHISCLIRLYDSGFYEGKRNMIDKYILSLNHELDDITDTIENQN